MIENPSTLLLKSSIATLKSWRMSPRQQCDVECILNGAFAPLTGFLNQTNYESVCENMRLEDGSLWSMPVTLDVSEDFAESLCVGEKILLTDEENTGIALLTIDSLWKPNKQQEALLVFGTNDAKHPAVNYLQTVAGTWYVGGSLTSLSVIQHYDFLTYRHTPTELKQLFRTYGWAKIIAFQTRNPMHRAHYELTRRATLETGANLLIHPVTGMTKPGDIDYVTRVKCYVQMLDKYKEHGAMLSLLPIAMRMGGPREAIWHALIRKNYGVTHFIVGRDHAGPGNDSNGQPFYDPYAAQQLLLKYANEIGIVAVPFSTMVYVKEKKQFLPEEEIGAEDTTDDISGTALRQKLSTGLPIPEWFTFPDIVTILQQSYPLKAQQGFTILFTGLSGAGKSTLAKALQARLQEISSRKITLLDGDIIRQHLSKELGFSPADRDTHIRRMGFLASEITKHNGICLIAAIAPNAETRLAVRNMISSMGGFLEIYVSTPLPVCQDRDVKGLYQKASQGLMKNMTGVSAPYEPPISPEMEIDTSNISVQETVDNIIQMLKKGGQLE